MPTKTIKKPVSILKHKHHSSSDSDSDGDTKTTKKPMSGKARAYCFTYFPPKDPDVPSHGDQNVFRALSKLNTQDDEFMDPLNHKTPQSDCDCRLCVRLSEMLLLLFDPRDPTVSPPKGYEHLFDIKLSGSKAKRQVVMGAIERCPAKKRIHIQGYLRFTNAVSVEGAKKTIQWVFPKSHIEVAITDGGISDRFNYQYIFGPYSEGRKEKPSNPTAYIFPEDYDVEAHSQGVRNDWTAIQQMVEDGTPLTDIARTYPSQVFKCYSGIKSMAEEYSRDRHGYPEAISNLELFEWQQMLCSRHFSNPPKLRHIYWIYSKAPSMGKTTFIKYLDHHFGVYQPAISSPLTSNHLVYAYESEPIIAFNLPRGMDSDCNLFNELLIVLEQFSDQSRITSTKYSGKTRHIQSHIVVTSNISSKIANKKMPKRIIGIHIDIERNGEPCDQYYIDYTAPTPVKFPFRRQEFPIHPIDSDAESLPAVPHHTVDE